MEKLTIRWLVSDAELANYKYFAETPLETIRHELFMADVRGAIAALKRAHGPPWFRFVVD